MSDATTSAGHELARQSLARGLSADEQALAAALERIFASGEHDFSKVTAALQQAQVRLPARSADRWTLDVLAAELRRINAELDEAYAKRPAVRWRSTWERQG